MFQSEIRQSEINELLEKVAKKSYGKYVFKLTLDRARGFRDQTLTFDFPVTAVVGPNGGGKTTVIGAVACLYKSVKPRQFFAKSGRFDRSMVDWAFEYDVLDRTINPKETFRRSVSFRSTKWGRDALDREVVTFGVARTVPPNERTELRKCASNSFNVDESRITKLAPAVAVVVQRILGKDVSEYNRIAVDAKGRVSLLSGVTGGVKYSEFHFGAGESSIIRMVMRIETLEENALVLIEEIENGLHPVATIRMVEYLIEVALRKKIQAVFTTHSNDALVPLPPKAIWSAVNNKVIQGKLDIHSLRAITGQVDAKLVLFVEDEVAKAWLQACLRAYGSIAVDLVQVHPMLGDGMAVTVNKHHNIDPSTKHLPSACYVDGDSGEKEAAADRVYRLPGQTPETFIYDRVLDRLETELGVLAVSLHRRFEDQQLVEKIVRSVRLTNMDPHLLFSQVGKQLGLIPDATVRGGFLNVWTQAYPDQVREILEPIKDLLPMEADVAISTSTAGAASAHSPEQGGAIVAAAVVLATPASPSPEASTESTPEAVSKSEQLKLVQ